MRGKIMEMKPMTLDDLPPVAKTLVIPLGYRALESLRPDGILRDERAVQIYTPMKEEIASLLKLSQHDQVFLALRIRQFDRFARNFLEKNPQGMVVDIGCGLDTRFYRLDNGSLLWYGIDLPEVIQLRCQLSTDDERCRLIPCSALDLAWLDSVAAERRPVIFLAEGLFPYFTEEEVKKLALALAERFPGSELVFDGVSSFSRWMHSRTDRSLKNTGAKINWAMDDCKILETWHPGIRLLEEWRYQQAGEPRLGSFNFMMRFIPLLAKINRLCRYRLGE
jgi:O-methyltransferase involved in polyketide biosynthesis